MLHSMTRLFDLCTNKSEVFPRFLTIAKVDFWCKFLHVDAWDKQTQDMDQI